MVVTCPWSDLVLPGAAPQDPGSNCEDTGAPVQYKRASMRTFRYAIDCTQMKLSAGQMNYKDDFDTKVRFRPVSVAEDFVYVDTPPRFLTNVKKSAHKCDTSDRTPASVNLLQRREDTFRVCIATVATVVIDEDRCQPCGHRMRDRDATGPRRARGIRANDRYGRCSLTRRGRISHRPHLSALQYSRESTEPFSVV